MNADGGVVTDTVRWFNDPLNWQGPDGVWHLTAVHLWITFAAVLLAAVVSLPLGVWMGHRSRGGGIVVVIANLSRAVPTLALLTLFAVANLGFGNRPTILALAVFAVPPLLANAYIGVAEVDRDAKDAARGMGMSGMQVLRVVELPLAVPLIAAGLRTAVVQVCATASLAALVAGGGLGVLINLGFSQRRFEQVLAGGLLIALLCLVLEGLLALLQRAVTPEAFRRSSAS
ncbi:ABC transporter permease [Angustibacter luteus]|uniref:ABC transporter permease n=1 Tax=Angustibacter luteus TaxID=658456 RepID=A0ABW1JG02_9ACTN